MSRDSQEKPDAERPLKVGMVGLGCAKNLVDGEVMLGHLDGAGFEITAETKEAEVLIINTCGFITEAKRESIDAILEAAQARKSGALKRLVVSGCMAQAYARELAAEIPEIDTFVGLDELELVVPAVSGLESGHIPDQRGALKVYDQSNPRLISTGVHAFLKVAEGCNNPCGFCHIPAMRGRFRSRRLGDLVAEARQLEAQGVRELILIAQDTTRYGEDIDLGRGGLKALVEALLEETDIPWIRFLYAYPSTLDPALFELMRDQPRFLPYLDIPLQHASRRVLKAMKRGGDRRRYTEMIAKARSIVPDLAIRTTFIVGFPGEEEEDFEELVDFVSEIRFDNLGVFTYSWQQENPGHELGDPVDEETKIRRRDHLMEIQQEISTEINQARIGDLIEVLVDGPLEEMPLLAAARSRGQAPEVDGRILINDGQPAAGTIARVEITEAHPYDLIGRVDEVVLEAPSSVGGFAV